MKRITAPVLAALLLALPLAPTGAAAAGRAAASQKSARQPPSVYEKQPSVTEKELLAFLDLLPQFRAWARAGNEEAHPVVRGGRPDFQYSAEAAKWVQARGWQPARFFCVMGRMAAALAIVEEGNDSLAATSKDMPPVSEGELALARRHLGTILKAGGNVPPPAAGTAAQ